MGNKRWLFIIIILLFFFVLHSSPSTRKWKGSSHAFHNNIRPRKNGMGQCWKEVASKTARATFDGLRFLWPTCSEFDRANSTERSLVYRKSNHPWKTSSQFLVADMAAAVHVHPSPIPPLEPVNFTLKFIFFSFFFYIPSYSISCYEALCCLIGELAGASTVRWKTLRGRPYRFGILLALRFPLMTS